MQSITSLAQKNPISVVKTPRTTRPNLVILDTETFLIRPGYAAPKVVALGLRVNNSETIVQPWYKIESALADLFTRTDVTIAGHHMAYDAAVLGASYPALLPLIFKAYEEDRVTCTMRRQQLLDIASGKRQGFRGPNGKWTKPRYGLDELANRFFGVSMNKAKKIAGCDACEDMPGKEPCYEHTPWQLRFGTLYDKPIEQWPAEPIDYLKDDVRITNDIFNLQEAHSEFLGDQYRKARAMFAVQLMTMWGLRTSEFGVRALEERTNAELSTVLQYLIGEGLARADGSRDTKAAAARMRQVCGENVRLTDKGNVSLDAEACEDSDDPALKEYARLTTLRFLLSKDVAALRQGVALPIHSRFDLIASGRMSSSSPNINNWSRGQKIRECFFPRTGCVYLQADYDGLELRTLAQACVSLVGWSMLAEALNSGQDPHVMLGANMLSLSYAEAMRRYEAKDPEVSDARQIGKIANFGYPGGLGAEAFADYAKAYSGGKILLSKERAKWLKALWEYTWPEVKIYGAIIESWRADARDKDGYVFPQLFSQRLRGGMNYTAARNTGFQGLGADAAQSALWALASACYVDQANPLYGARVVNFIHDEFFLEIRETTPEIMTVQGAELTRIMTEYANKFLPNVPATTSPVLMRYWSKSAHEMFNEAGHLIPWSQEICKCKKCQKT